MSRIASWAGVVVAIVIAIAVMRIATTDPAPSEARAASVAGSRPQRPPGPPGPNDPKPPAVAEPAMPVLSPEWRAQIADQVRGRDRPGEAAFRAVSDRYVDENLAFAEHQAAAEGLTLPEMRELTYFGLMVLATQRFDDVAELTGHPIATDQRDALGQLMQSTNGEFREAMRALVAGGAREADRWALIRSTEARYQAALFRISGLDAGLLDDLLAGNIALPGAPARGDDLPAGVAPGGVRDQPTAPPRPHALP